MAMLIAESEEGTYEPVSPVGSIGEGREIARDDFRRRMAGLERGGSPLCPTVYKLWSRRFDGQFAVLAEFPTGVLSA
jgi:hypothetical protein